ncbi:MAG: polyprenol monophosphomannose synthase [Bacteroidetes bacterium]|nr:MAG: polyprenol monophosphomannose synthase [Bacteroidota bacterium]MBL1143545.1 polyprenol monophosphomannose synthase [Bacteroidota bacterium]MCB0801955.1 polyprenol monophosphomannose synthase [Flavobacteriales bacterium]NOG56347.1 polyprenol monophosphomannose synthase [Bacteroidota bacterium]
MPKKLVIIPTYNELENIRQIIDAVLTLQEEFHVLIVDDGSPDGTADIVKSLFDKYPNRLFIEERKGKQGLGTAYIHGFKWGLANQFDYLFEMDADFSHNPNDLIRLFEACHIDGADLAIGSRYVKGVNVVNWPMGRVLMSYYASVYVRFITGMSIHDSTAGFKCYKRVVLETINLDQVKFKGYAFQIEMKFTTWKFGFKIKEVPIIFTDRQEGTSKMSTGIFKEAFLGVIYLRLSSLFKKYKR